MMPRTFLVVAGLLLGLLAPDTAVAQNGTIPVADGRVTASSPDGHITVTISRSSENHLQYEVARDGTTLIAPSRIGFRFTDQDPLTRGVTIDGSEISTADTRWDQPWGERKTVIDRHTELVVRFHDRAATAAMAENFADRPFVLRVRVFDDGVGFRTEFPARATGDWNIADEDTQFVIARPGTAWWIQAGDFNRYEQLYKRTAIDAVGTAHTPMTVRLDDGTHLSFHEAALVDYSGMWLQRIEGQRFKATLAPSSHGPRVTRTGAFSTPWRSIRIAAGAAGLYDNDLELNLNEPNRLGDVSWVKPFRYVGIWWGLHLDLESWNTGAKHGATTANTPAHDRLRRRPRFSRRSGRRVEPRLGRDLVRQRPRLQLLPADARLRSCGAGPLCQGQGRAPDRPSRDRRQHRRVRSSSWTTPWRSTNDWGSTPSRRAMSPTPAASSHPATRPAPSGWEWHGRPADGAAPSGGCGGGGAPSHLGRRARTRQGHGPAPDLSQLGVAGGCARWRVSGVGRTGQSARSRPHVDLHPDAVRPDGLHARRAVVEGARRARSADDIGQGTGPLHRPLFAHPDGGRPARTAGGAPARTGLHLEGADGLGEDAHAGGRGGRVRGDRAQGSRRRRLVRRRGDGRGGPDRAGDAGQCWRPGGPTPPRSSAMARARITGRTGGTPSPTRRAPCVGATNWTSRWRRAVAMSRG